MADMKGLALSIFLVFTFAGSAEAGWAEAIAAYNRGDYETAVREYQVLAEQGDAEAQFTLGFLYGGGRGVPQNYVLAYIWLDLAASRLKPLQRDAAVRGRDYVASLMTPTQISEAQRLVREWKPKKQ